MEAGLAVSIVGKTITDFTELEHCISADVILQRNGKPEMHPLEAESFNQMGHESHECHE